MSSWLQGRLGAGVAEFVHLEEQHEYRVLPVLAVAWLVASLERSGPTGRQVLDAARVGSPYIERFLFFGPFWTAAMLSAASRGPAMSEWWPRVTTIDEFMGAHAAQRELDAWSALCRAGYRRLSDSARKEK